MGTSLQCLAVFSSVFLQCGNVFGKGLVVIFRVKKMRQEASYHPDHHS